MDQKQTDDCVQNAVEDLIPTEQFIEGVTKVLVDNPVALNKAFVNTCRQESAMDALI